MKSEYFFNQAEFEIRCEWGMAGVTHLAPISDVVIIVDVLSFSTAVEIATSRGAIVYPYRGDNAEAYAQKKGAILAAKPGRPGYSLSPSSLVEIEVGTHLILPSPNGSTLTLGTGNTPTLAGCLRNCAAVAQAAMSYGPNIAVIPAGERWLDENRSLRPAYEDWIGAGAIISQLSGNLSPEARAARAAYLDIESQSELEALLRASGSGKEHIGRNMAANVPLAAALDVSGCVPVLVDGAYRVRYNSPE